MTENNTNKFYELTSNLTSFSHAYLFSVDSIEKSMPMIIDFAKKILCPNNHQTKEEQENCDICYQIERNHFDDLYILNPDSIAIKKEEIDNLMEYFRTKSLRENGKRVYIICGFERLREDVSNKILKFLEEPEENIHAILLTENIDKILSTIISRCQVINIKTDDSIVEDNVVNDMKAFIEKIIKSGTEAIAYVQKYWSTYIQDREQFEIAFDILEKIYINEINKRYNIEVDEKYQTNILENYNINDILKMLEITSQRKRLIKRNINLNLLLDRYIIEVTKR